MGKYIAQFDCENALSAQTIAQLYVDDATAGVLNVLALNQDIDLAEAEVDSWLIGVRDVASLKRWDSLLRACALDYFKSFAFARHPEYVRTYGESDRSWKLYTLSRERMERIQAATQQLTNQPNLAMNVGGIVRANGPRMMINSPDGTENGNGF